MIDENKIKINGKEYLIINSEIKYINATHNNISGYSILVNIKVNIKNDVGFVSFFVDFFDTNKFINIENKKYKELPTELDSKISMIEIYTVDDFIDFIDSDFILEFGKINNNMIEMKLSIDDELIKIEYDDIILINYNNNNNNIRGILNNDLDNLLLFLKEVLSEHDFNNDRVKVNCFYKEIEKMKEKLPTIEKLNELQEIALYLEVNYEEFYEIDNYFSPIYSKVKNIIHKEKIDKLRRENRRKRCKL